MRVAEVVTHDVVVTGSELASEAAFRGQDRGEPGKLLRVRVPRTYRVLDSKPLFSLCHSLPVLFVFYILPHSDKGKQKRVSSNVAFASGV